ncbi:unnamed protein product [Camellia sinensis]
MGPSRPSIFLLLFLSVVVCMSGSNFRVCKFSVRSTIDVVQQVATLVSRFAEFANSVRSTIEVVQLVSSLVSRFAEFANSVRLTIEVVQQVASLVSRFAEFAISVRLTIEVVQQVASLVSRFAGAFSDFRLSKAIAVCLDLHDLSADKLTPTLSASQSPNGTYERVRVNLSAERSRRSRQSAMALERRKSLNAPANVETTEATCCTTSMVNLTEIANSANLQTTEATCCTTSMVNLTEFANSANLETREATSCTTSMVDLTEFANSANLETRVATCCTTSMVDLTEFANSEIGTFKNSDSTKSGLELPSEADIHTTTDKNNSKKMEGREGPI